MPKEKSAGAIIFRKESGNIYYLLLHYPGINRKGGHWEFAKGHIENNEAEEITAIREIKEETGISDVIILPGFKKYIKYFFKKNKNISNGQTEKHAKKSAWIFKLVTFFIAETKTKEVNLSPEHTDFLWLLFDEAYKKVTYKNSKELLKEANDFLRSYV
jgi:8-oxo-dGTP pyrophosphatase MutT (NUDIX family)